MMAENVVLPGDRVSSAEEYEAGSNTFDDMGIIRADTIEVHKYGFSNSILW